MSFPHAVFVFTAYYFGKESPPVLVKNFTLRFDPVYAKLNSNVLTTKGRNNP